MQGLVGDAQDFDLTSLGTFDIVHCYELLHHLDSPVAALRRIESVCSDLLVLETIVCDSSRPLMILVDEDRSANQALAGLACRPSPSFVAMALNRVGFPFVYGARTPPSHEDFQVDWRDDMSYSRDGHNLRCIMVASRRRLTIRTRTAHPNERCCGNVARGGTRSDAGSVPVGASNADERCCRRWPRSLDPHHAERPVALRGHDPRAGA